MRKAQNFKVKGRIRPRDLATFEQKKLLHFERPPNMQKGSNSLRPTSLIPDLNPHTQPLGQHFCWQY